MNLSIGSVGEAVRQLQGFLNLLPTLLPRLATDGQFGQKTRGRVQEFQSANRLAPDGIAGPLTMGAIMELLRKLGLLPGPAPVTPSAVRPINQEILGMNGPGNLIEQIIPPIGTISVPSFRRGDQKNKPQFFSAAGTVGRLGIFAAKKGDSERAVILLLPKSGKPTRLLICITQGFGQAAKNLIPLGWTNPLSPPFVQFALLKHVINRWGAQTLASKKQMAFLYILRAGKGPELGPFTNDGDFVVQVLTELAALTNDAFSFGAVEAFTFSSGIHDFNRFLGSVSGKLNVETVYSIDTNPPVRPSAPKAAHFGFLSGQTFRGAPPAGFEFMPEGRWENETLFPTRGTFPNPATFNYLHNWVMPMYALHLGIQLS